MTSALEREIREQAEVLRRRCDGDDPAVAQGAALLSARGVTQLVIAARGTSDNVARYAQYLLGHDARLLVGLAAPSLYRDPARAPRLDGAAVLGISQSGQSPDIAGVLAAARAQGRPALALTNDPASPLAAQADVVIPLHAGVEQSVAATKTYVASLFAVAQLAQALAPLDDRDDWLERVPRLVDNVVAAQLAGRERFALLTSATLLTVVGRALTYGSAFETALKLRELTGIAAEAFSPADLLHGPIAAIGGGVVWMVVAERRTPHDVLELAATLRRRGVAIVAVTRDRELAALADLAVVLPDVPEWVVPMLAVLPAQAAALAVAERRGVSVDVPHGLAKVTRTS